VLVVPSKKDFALVLGILGTSPEERVRCICSGACACKCDCPESACKACACYCDCVGYKPDAAVQLSERPESRIVL